ncbi:MAG: EAL domain-containing protein [Aquificae bacterium]|nr:EAL domain-containing protein [Aquificota bacterium]
MKKLEKLRRFKKEFYRRIGEDYVIIHSDRKPVRRKKGKVLYFVSPILALEYYRNGYRPIARFSDCREEVLLVAREGEEIKTLGILKFCTSLFALFREELSGEPFSLKIFSSAETLLRAFESGDVDAILLTTESPLPRGGKILRRIPLSHTHLFMTHPLFSNRLKIFLKTFGNVEFASEEDLEKEILTLTKTEEVLKKLARAEDRERFLNALPVGIVFLGKEGSTESFNQEAGRILNPKKGEKFPGFFEEEERVHLLLKEVMACRNGKVLCEVARAGNGKYVQLYLRRLSDEKSLVLMLDVSRRVSTEKVYGLMQEAFNTAINSLSEDELFHRFLQSLVSRHYFVHTQILDASNLTTLYYRGSSRLREFVEKKDPFVRKALTSREIIILPSVEKEKHLPEDLRELLLKSGVNSCAYIPVHSNQGYLLVCMAREPEFFHEYQVEMLSEFRDKMALVLRKLRTIKESTLIKNAMERAHEWFLITDEDGTILYTNKAVAKISGYGRKELIGKNPRIFKSGYHTEEFYRKLWKRIKSGKSFSSIFINRKKDGSIFYLQQTIFPVHLPSGERRFVGLGKDITKEIELTGQVEELRFFDFVTGLLNAQGFATEVSALLERAKGYCMLVLLDLYNFTYINNVYGVSVGDRVLREVGKRLLKTFEGSVVARLGSDEFGIFIPNLKTKREIFLQVELLKELFKDSIRVEGHSVTLSINAGVSVYPTDGRSYQELYRKASLALRYAKREGENEVKFYNALMEREALDFVNLEMLIEKAVKKGLFIFHYQPYYRSSDLSLAGFEALVRIRDEKGRIYYPKDFIDYLEYSKFLKDFDNWVLSEALEKIHEWGVEISVNIPVRSIKNKKFITKLLNMCEDFGGKLTVEITERIFTEEMEEMKEILRKINRCVKIAIDDFGMGYSSFYYLRELPVDRIKIDMTFIKGMLENPKDMAMVEVIVEFAKKLGIETVAEGVELEEQVKVLRELGCTYLQGFYFAKPMPEEEAEKLVKGK